MTEYAQRRQYLLARQKEIEAELGNLKAGGWDRRSRKWNELEVEYAEIVEEIERLAIGGERAMADTEQGGMTVSEAGRRGGKKVLEKYGREHFVAAGKKGGQIVSKERGREYYVQIGHMGGTIVKERHGDELYSRIGKLGGEAVKAKYGEDYYALIGKKGGQHKKRKDGE